MAIAADVEIHARETVLSTQAYLAEAIEDTNRWAQTNDDATFIDPRLRDAKEVVDERAVAIYTPLSPSRTVGLSEAIANTVAELRSAASVLEASRDRSGISRDAPYSVSNTVEALTEAQRRLAEHQRTVARNAAPGCRCRRGSARADQRPATGATR